MSIVKREILYPGKKDIGELEPETKLIYHFETVIINDKDSDPTVIDDSRRMAKDEPVETIYGKQFKLPIWESCLSAMRIGEICRLTVRDDPITHYICLNYVTTSKCFRKHYGVTPTKCEHNQDHSDSDLNAAALHGCCMSLRSSPYEDLNKMIQHPPEMFVFTFELVDIIPPKSYAKEIWQMSDSEKLSMIPKFREDGNKNFAECDYDAALSSYTKGLSVIESLMLKERPKDSDWFRLEEMKTPFLLNLALIKLTQGEYYDCIKYTDEVLKKDPENIKALFRRAKAHAGVWNISDAKKDFKKCIEYDKTMTKTVTKCFQELKVKEMMKNKEDKERFMKMLGNDTHKNN